MCYILTKLPAAPYTSRGTCLLGLRCGQGARQARSSAGTVQHGRLCLRALAARAGRHGARGDLRRGRTLAATWQHVQSGAGHGQACTRVPAQSASTRQSEACRTRVNALRVHDSRARRTVGCKTGDCWPRCATCGRMVARRALTGLHGTQKVLPGSMRRQQLSL